MRSSSRPRVSIVLSLVAVVSMLLTCFVFTGKSAFATSSVAPHYGATKGKIASVKTVDPRKLPTGKAAKASKPTLAIPYRSARRHTGSPLKVPHVRGSSLTVRPHLGEVLANFDGVNALNNYNLNGFQVEPPDQGLCVGNGFVVELVNLAGAIYHPNGSVAVGPFALAPFYGEPAGDPFVTGVFISDPRCYFDASTNTWFATVLAIDQKTFPPTTHLDLAVNPSGDPTTSWTIYRIDTTDVAHPGCPCLPDFPIIGIDQFNLYISTNEFAFFAPFFNGAQIYAISKSQLVSRASQVNIVHFDKLTIGGDPASTLQPAITIGSANAEYLMNSFSFDTLDTRLGVWALTNQQAVTTGGMPTLSSIIISSEVYALPSPAPNPNGNRLSPDDDFLAQLVSIKGNLWTSLDTALFVDGDTHSRDGAAWFQVQPQLSGDGTTIADATIANQGYIAVKGNYLLYPAIAVNNDGTATMAVSVTGPQTLPSAGFTVRPAGGGFGAVRIAAAGAATDNGFSCGGVSFPCRWGDYSAAVLDPAGTNFWLATEYIPPVGTALANWGTRIFEVQGS